MASVPLRCQQTKLAAVRRRRERDGHQHREPPLPQRTTIGSSKNPVEREALESQPTPPAFPHTTQRGRSVKQNPDDIIGLTLDSSNDEYFETPDKGSPSKNGYNDLQNTQTPLPSERTPSEPSIRGFSMGPTILGPMLNLTKEPHDKPRSFIRYTVDFEVGLANISAHGFVDQIYMAPRW